MDIYRVVSTDFTEIERAEEYYRRYSGEFALVSTNSSVFSMEEALKRVSKTPRISIISKLKLNCDLVKKMLRYNDVKPTTIYFTFPYPEGIRVIKEIQI